MKTWHRRCIFLLLMVVQIAVILAWAGEKTNYYVDELYSFGYAKEFDVPRSEFRKISKSDDWQYEKWIDNIVFKDRLTVFEEDSILNYGLLPALRMLLFSKYNYFGLLNLFQSAVSPGTMSFIPGLILNLLLFVFTQLMIFRIVRELTGSDAAGLMAVVLYGFSGMAIGMSLYIRFYAWTIFLLLASLRLHQILWREDRLLRFVLLTVPAMGLLLMALRNSQLIFILGTCLAAVFLAGCVLRRRFQQACAYFVTVVPASVYYILRKTNFLHVIMHPEDYASENSAEGLVSRGLLGISPDKVVQCAGNYLKWLSYELFGSRYVLLGFGILLLILFVLWLKRDKEQSFEEDERIRFVWIIVVMAAGYLFAAFRSGLSILRYLSFLFPPGTIIFWTLLHFLTRGRTYRQVVLWISAGLIALGCFSLYFRHSDAIEYLYREDRPLIQALEETDIEDVVMVWTGTHFSLYDGVSILPASARLYPVSSEQHAMDPAEFPDRVLVWISEARAGKVKNFLPDLIAGGYKIRKLGQTHASTVYIAERSGMDD